MKKIRVGTRGSRLALRQTEIAIDALRSQFNDFEFEVRIIKTTGDTFWDRPLTDIKGKGLFVKELEEALLSGEIDLAVHSMKDVPIDLRDGLKIGAILKREDPRDCFISFDFDSIKDLPKGAKLGTSSLRRKVQLEMVKSEIEVIPIRGNVETRLKKIRTQGLSGIVLAYCGVKRLGLESYVKEIIPKEIMVPCAGQGAIGLEIREGWEYEELLDAVKDEVTETEIELERKILKLMGGGCQLPFGVNVEKVREEFFVHAFVAGPGGKDGTRIKIEIPVAERELLPRKVIDRLSPLQGAQEI